MEAETIAVVSDMLALGAKGGLSGGDGDARRATVEEELGQVLGDGPEPEDLSQDFGWEPEVPAELHGDVVADAGFPEAPLAERCRTRGGQGSLRRLLTSPSADAGEIAHRVERRRFLASPEAADLRRDIRAFAEDGAEDEALWVCGERDLTAWPLDMVYWKRLRFMNERPLAIRANLVVRCWVLPAVTALTPLVALVSPWIAIRRRFPLSLGAYLRLVLGMVRGLARTDGILPTIVSITAYLGVWAYSLDQSLRVAMAVWRTQRGIARRADAARRACALAARLPEGPVAPPLAGGLVGAYRASQDPGIRQAVRDALVAIWGADAMIALGEAVADGESGVREVEVGADETRFAGLGHPALPDGQVRSDVGLDASLAVTGPNRAGKSTLLRAVLASQVAAQSAGVAFAAGGGAVHVYGALSSHMRVRDTLAGAGAGGESLFEAATRLLHGALDVARGAAGGALLFLDEPLHSTPPVEGGAIVRAFVEETAKIDGCRVVVTSHFPDLARVECGGVRHLSVEADESTDPVTFPHVVREGPSSQCIAFKLLREAGILSALVDRAEDLCRRPRPTRAKAAKTPSPSPSPPSSPPPAKAPARCAGRTRTGLPCSRPPVAGGDTCTQHAKTK